MHLVTWICGLRPRRLFIQPSDPSGKRGPCHLEVGSIVVGAEPAKQEGLQQASASHRVRLRQRIDGHAQTPLQLARVDDRIDPNFHEASLRIPEVDTC